jgi:hypothetical protein
MLEINAYQNLVLKSIGYKIGEKFYNSIIGVEIQHDLFEQIYNEQTILDAQKGRIVLYHDSAIAQIEKVTNFNNKHIFKIRHIGTNGKRGPTLMVEQEELKPLYYSMDDDRVLFDKLEQIINFKENWTVDNIALNPWIFGYFLGLAEFDGISLKEFLDFEEEDQVVIYYNKTLDGIKIQSAI